METAVNVADKFLQVRDHWSPRIIAELNGQAVKIARVTGDFVWHDHAEEDELFYVLSGTLYIDLQDAETVTIKAGELYVVPRGVTHRPRTLEGEEVQLMLLEPLATRHTGTVEHALTQQTAKYL